MAKAGFRIMDSDIHVLEPHDLWVRYMEPAFRDRAPRFAPIEGSAYEGWQFDGKVFPAFFDRPDRRRLARVRKDKARVRHLATGRYRDPAEDLPGGRVPPERSAQPGWSAAWRLTARSAA